MNAARYCFLLLAVLFRKIANMRIFASGCFRQQMEEPCEFLKGGSGFRRALKRVPDP